ncbi:transglutaminase domain-containing protein [Rummeliibacillus sp. JY-2-4R]
MKRFLASLLGILLVLGTVFYLRYDVYADANANAPAITNQAQLKQEILKNLDQVKPEFIIPTKIPVYKTKEAEKMFKDVMKELSSTANYGYGNLNGYSYYISSNMGYVQIKFKSFYLTNTKQEKMINQEVKKIVETNQLKKMSDFEKVYFVNGYLASHIAYSENATNGGHTAYDALFDHKAVCQGYALAAYRILTEAGVETRYITGKVHDQNHAWNKVKLNGKWYNLDITWNDPMPDRGDRYRLNYFLISDQQLAKDHTWNYRTIDAATSKNYEFLMNAQAFTLDKNVLYFTEQSDANFYKWNLNTNKKTVLFQNYLPVKYIQKSGNWLTLESFNGNYAKVKSDGSNFTGYTENNINNLTASFKQ